MKLETGVEVPYVRLAVDIDGFYGFVDILRESKDVVGWDWRDEMQWVCSLSLVLSYLNLFDMQISP